MSDTALLAASLAIAERQQQQQLGSPQALTVDAVAAEAGGLLQAWVPAVQAAVVGSGLLSGEAMAALLVQWDWRPVLQQAAAQLLQQRGGGTNGSSANVAEVRRAMQRSVRVLADLIRRGSHGG